MKRTRQRQKNIARLAIQIVDERRQCSQLRVLQEREGHISDQSVQRRPVQHPVRCQSCRQQDHHIRIALRLGHIALDEVAPEPLPELEVTPRRSDQRLEVSRDQARHLKRATVRDLRKYVGMPLPPRKPEQSGYQRCPLLRRQCPASHQQQVDITLRAEPRRRTGAIEVHPDDPTGIGREHSVEYRLDQIVHINGDYAPQAPRGNDCIVQPRTRIAQVESKLTRTKVRSKHPSDQGFYTLNLNSTACPHVGQSAKTFTRRARAGRYRLPFTPPSPIRFYCCIHASRRLILTPTTRESSHTRKELSERNGRDR